MRLSETRFACQYSGEFLKRKKYYICQTGYLMKYSPQSSARTPETSFQNALKTHLTRRGFDPFKELGIAPLLCHFCGQRNATWDLEYVNDNRKIQLTGIRYRKPNFFCYGSKGNCKGKKLNANSVEFVAGIYGLSEAEALIKIHERNRSPFYCENHPNNDEYKKFQRDQFYGRSLDKVRTGIIKIQTSRLKNQHGMNVRTSGFSYISEEDGHLLRSNGERFFYQCAKSIGIAHELSSNGFYPGTFLCYDFYFSKIGLFVEICGIKGEKYETRIEEKVNTFGSAVLKLSRTYKKDCKEFLDGVKTTLEQHVSL